MPSVPGPWPATGDLHTKLLKPPCALLITREGPPLRAPQFPCRPIDQPRVVPLISSFYQCNNQMFPDYCMVRPLEYGGVGLEEALETI